MAHKVAVPKHTGRKGCRRMRGPCWLLPWESRTRKWKGRRNSGVVPFFHTCSCQAKEVSVHPTYVYLIYKEVCIIMLVYY